MVRRRSLVTNPFRPVTTNYEEILLVRALQRTHDHFARNNIPHPSRSSMKEYVVINYVLSDAELAELNSWVNEAAKVSGGS